ncbi:MAG: hypothetical protein LBS21_04215 [Clostridiales bacterium]|nr:hypothetical protein [Clostridiales bacterium]
MEQAISAYRSITATNEFKEAERLRIFARHNEASALGHAWREATRKADEKWQVFVADKDAAHNLALADKDAALADKDAENAKLLQLIAELKRTHDTSN